MNRTLCQGELSVANVIAAKSHFHQRTVVASLGAADLGCRHRLTVNTSRTGRGIATVVLTNASAY